MTVNAVRLNHAVLFVAELEVVAGIVETSHRYASGAFR